MDQLVKERMVGAAVLVLAAVIFIPMILAGSAPERAGDGHATSSQASQTRPSTSTSATTAGESRFSSRIVPLGESPSARSVEQENAIEKARKRVSENEVETPITAQAAKPMRSPPVAASRVPPAVTKKAAGKKPTTKKATTKKATTKKATTKKPAASKVIATPAGKGAWVVQLGSFSSARNAQALRARLKSKGYKAFVRSSVHGAEAVTRVYVGPDASRDGAQKLVARLLEETRLKGIVVRYPE